MRRFRSIYRAPHSSRLTRYLFLAPHRPRLAPRAPRPVDAHTRMRSRTHMPWYGYGKTASQFRPKFIWCSVRASSVLASPRKSAYAPAPSKRWKFDCASGKNHSGLRRRSVS